MPPGSPDYTDPLREAAIRSRLETILLANMAGPELRDFDGVGKFWGVPLDT
jgi:hypothetical protein